MVAYRLEKDVGAYMRGTTLLVMQGHMPSKGEVAVVWEGGRVKCVVYDGQPHVIGAVVGAVVR